MLVSKTKYEELAEKLAEKESFLKELSERFEVQKDTILELRQELARAREQSAGEEASPLPFDAAEPPAPPQTAPPQTAPERTPFVPTPPGEAMEPDTAPSTEPDTAPSEELTALRKACQKLDSRLQEQEARYETTLLRFSAVKQTLEQRHNEELTRLKAAQSHRLEGYDQMLRKSAQWMHRLLRISNLTPDQKQYLTARIEELLSFLAEQEEPRS